uniref:Uncharacterized protein n=1 Tax=Arundo donax TaxID=35708 RepID=A0A0A9B031_ARUDO
MTKLFQEHTTDHTPQKFASADMDRIT